MNDRQIIPHLRLLAVVGPPFVDADTVYDSCLAAEAGGVTALQVRWKNASASQQVEVTSRLARQLSIPVYVNDRVDVALAGRAAGVHVGTDDLAPEHVRSIAPRPFKIGVSVGTDDEAKAALGADVDYWSLGAIYHTSTKGDAGAPIGTEGFKRLASFAPRDMPVIAIGGIDQSNVREIIEAGAQGVAVVSAIFGSSTIEENARALRSIVDSLP